MSHYNTLGVDNTASQEEIKKAYRKLAMQYHPDRNSGDKAAEDKLKQINEAYGVLSNEQKRNEYDNPDPFANFMGGFGDIFNVRNRRGPVKKPMPSVDTPRRGQDLKFVVDVPMYSFIIGEDHELEVSYMDICMSCNGIGATELQECPNCRGTGVISKTINRGQDMVMHTTANCPSCAGKGFIPKDTCESCHGTGGVSVDRKIVYAVLPNTKDGEIGSFKGKGGKGTNGAPDGNLYLKYRMTLPKVENLTEEQIELLKEIK